jgi:hypothetical protein
MNSEKRVRELLRGLLEQGDLEKNGHRETCYEFREDMAGIVEDMYEKRPLSEEQKRVYEELIKCDICKKTIEESMEFLRKMDLEERGIFQGIIDFFRAKPLYVAVFAGGVAVILILIIGYKIFWGSGDFSYPAVDKSKKDLIAKISSEIDKKRANARSYGFNGYLLPESYKLGFASGYLRDLLEVGITEDEFNDLLEKVTSEKLDLKEVKDRLKKGESLCSLKVASIDKDDCELGKNAYAKVRDFFDGKEVDLKDIQPNFIRFLNKYKDRLPFEVKVEVKEDSLFPTDKFVNTSIVLFEF